MGRGLHVQLPVILGRVGRGVKTLDEKLGRPPEIGGVGVRSRRPNVTKSSRVSGGRIVSEVLPKV